MKEPESQHTANRTRFLLRNLGRGFLWLAVIVSAYLLARRYLDFDLKILLGPVYEQPLVIYSIFLFSETVFGIIPPEFFMFWASQKGVVSIYVQHIVLLASMSYLAGVLGYFIGSFFNTTRLYALVKKNFLGKVEKHFNHYGGFLVVVAALTPLPFSGICMLVGAVKYPLYRFLLIACTRFIRFIAYAYIVWEAQII